MQYLTHNIFGNCKIESSIKLEVYDCLFIKISIFGHFLPPNSYELRSKTTKLALWLAIIIANKMYENQR